MYKAFIVFSILSALISASDNNDHIQCVSYFDVVSGSEHISYKETPCYKAREILGLISQADGVRGLKVCTENQCKEFGPLGMGTVKMLLSRINEKSEK